VTLEVQICCVLVVYSEINVQKNNQVNLYDQVGTVERFRTRATHDTQITTNEDQPSSKFLRIQIFKLLERDFLAPSVYYFTFVSQEVVYCLLSKLFFEIHS